MKISNTKVIEHGQIKFILTWKLHPFMLALLNLEDDMNVLVKEN